MKKYILALVIFFFCLSAFSQGLWIPKADPPNNNSDNVSFTLNSIGYIYTGGATNNFYAYNPSTNTWLAKADFPGVSRSGAAGFATTSYGYIGTGVASGRERRDFYKYDPSGNSWSTIAVYPDSLEGAFAFAIGTKGYLAGGFRDTMKRTCYAYNEGSNTWDSIAPIPFAMAYGISAVVNVKGYCGLGDLASGARVGNMYEYDPIGDTWTAKTFSSITGYTYTRLNAFVITNKIYVADPNALTGPHAAMRVFDAIANTWSVTNTYPYPKACSSFTSTSAFSIANKGYLGGSASCTPKSFWQYDTAFNFVINSFTPDTVCEGDNVTVNFSSNLTFGSGNYFKLKVQGNGSSAMSDSISSTTTGTFTFKVPFGTNPGNTSAASLNIYSTNAPNQSEYLVPTLLIKKAPEDRNMPSAFNSCGGSALLLYRDNSSDLTHTWTSDPPGVSSSSATLSFIPTATTSIFAYDVVTSTGCSLRDTAVVTLHGQPALNITDSSFAICPGSSVTLGGTYTAGSSYRWTGNGLSSSSVNPVVSPTSGGTYHVLVHDTVTTCSVSGNTTVTIKDPPAQNICFVTVDSASTHNVVVWEKLDKYATDSFHIYRETSTGIYTEIAAIHRDSLSEYHDYAANPNVTGYRYRISAGDTCHNGSTPSHYHNTIHLQYLGSGNLIWNVYQIENETTPVTSFDVYWDTLANGNWQVMLNVPGNQYTATDINFNRHPGALYRIVAHWSYTCTPSRSGSSSVLSNVINIGPNGINGVEDEQSIRLYPIPAKNEITILAGGKQIENILITSADGRVITHISAPEGNRVDVSNLADGVYIAEVIIGNTTSKLKWVKMK